MTIKTCKTFVRIQSRMGDIPIIDLERLGLHKEECCIDKDNLESVGQKMKNALGSVGFCYLKNHGIDQTLIDNFFMSMYHIWWSFQKKYQKNISEKYACLIDAEVVETL